MTLALADVSVAFAGRTVVDRVSGRFEPGTFVAVVGPNGAGKSSLVRAIAGLVPSAGTVSLDGLPVRDLDGAARARRIAYLPQGHQIHWALPVADIVALGRFPHGVRDPARLSPQDRRAVERAFDLTGTRAFAARRVTELSGGERARVALARVLAGEASVILADEPTAALDPRYRIEMMTALRACAEAGAVVLAVTHDLVLAARLAHTVLVLNEGRLASLGAPAEALTEAVYRDVFRVETIAVPDGATPVRIPWSVG